MAGVTLQVESLREFISWLIWEMVRPMFLPGEFEKSEKESKRKC